MNDLSIGNADLVSGIQELSNEEIDLVSGGWMRGINILIEIGKAIYNNWDPIDEVIMETIDFHGGGWPATL